MGLFDHFPYTNVHELNLDWILSMMKALDAEWEAFIAGNSLTFADPMLHDVTKTYAKNTIVLDSNGNAYVSLQAVPVGVGLQNGYYWLMVFDYEAFIEKVNKNFTANYYRGSYRATAAMSIGDWLTVDDVLYKATAAIAVDDILEDGVNITHFTLEDFIKAFMQSANQLIQQYKNDIDASELLYRQQLAQDIADTTASLQAQLDAAIAGVTVDSEVINARVGANGITYDTLGDAIRSQFSDNNKIINDSLKNAPIVLTPESLISTATSPISLTPTPYTGFKCAVIDCSAGDLFTINIEGGGTSALGFVFIDSSNNPITAARPSVTYSDVIICAPANAAKLIINTKNDGVSYRGISWDPEKAYFEKLIGTNKDVVLYDEYISNPTNYAQNTYAFILDFNVANARYVKLQFMTDDAGKILFYPLRITPTGYEILDEIEYHSSDGLNIAVIDWRKYTGACTIAVRGYTNDDFVPYAAGGSSIPYRIAAADLVVGNTVTPTQGSTQFYFNYKISANVTENKQCIILDASGNGDYIDVVEAFDAANDGDIIYVKSGTYHLDNGVSLNPTYKKLYIIGENRDDTIIESNDARYAYSLLYLTSGLLENITLQCIYVAGVSNDITGETNGQYALHTEGSTGKNKKLTIRNAKLISDFFAAYGCGMSEGLELTIENSQFISNAPVTSDTNDYGAMYLHDCGYELQAGTAYLSIFNSTFEVLRDHALGLSHTNSYGNPVVTKFIGNTTYSAQNGLDNNVLLRHSPYSQTFTMSGMSWNNSDSDLNN